jgi:hypothetical protein
MIALIDKTIAEGFSQPADRVLFKEVDTIEALFTILNEPGVPDRGTLTGRM